MDFAVKYKWLKALRGGKYKQGRGALKSLDDRFCCLGVLCDIIDNKLWTHSGIYKYDSEISGISVPLTLRGEIGLDSDLQSELMRMNDSGKSFAEIADKIEAEA